MLTLVTRGLANSLFTWAFLQMVTMQHPLRPKTGDHAYFGYQGSGLFTVNIKKIKTLCSFLQMVTM